MNRTFVLAASVLMAACTSDSPGSEPESPSPSPVTQPAEPSVPDSPPDCDRNNIDCVESLGSYLAASEGFTGVPAESFTLAYQICSVYPPQDFVDQGYDTGGSTDPVDVAQAYAEETFTPASQQAGFEGCLSAFEGRP